MAALPKTDKAHDPHTEVLRSKAKKGRAKKYIKVDWVAIEQDWRTGRFSINEIATMYHKDSGTTIEGLKQAIWRHVEDEGWKRDLTEQVRQETNAQLYSDQDTPHDPEAERKLIKAAASDNVKIIREHRTQLAKGFELATALLQEAIEDQADKNGSLNIRARTTTTIINGLSKVIDKERVAHNMDDSPTAPKRFESKMVMMQNMTLDEIRELKTRFEAAKERRKEQQYD